MQADANCTFENKCFKHRKYLNNMSLITHHT